MVDTTNVKPVFNWYAVYTRPCFEKMVSEFFNKQKIENYCPLQKIVRQWSDRKKIIMEPIFRSYVFVRISNNEQVIVRETKGVINFVNFLKKPAIIPNHEIDTIKKFLSEYKNVKLERLDFSYRDNVRIVSGPLMMMDGTVIKVKHKTVTVLLPSLGFSMVAEIEKENLINVPI